MMAKAEEILPPSAAVAGGTSEERPLQEAENREGARRAKRPRTLPANLDAPSSPAKEGEESGGLGLRGISFSFDTKSIAPIGTTPKFGSFHGSALDLMGFGESALIEEKEAEGDKKGEAKRRRMAPPALDTRASPATAEEDKESGGSARVGFSFSFDVRTTGAVEANPKFGSFLCTATDLGTGAAEAGDGVVEDSGGDVKGTAQTLMAVPG